MTKRDADKQLTPLPGGSSDKGKSFWLNDIDLYAQSNYINSFLDTIDLKLTTKKKNKNPVPSIVKITLIDKAIATSFRADLNNLFKTRGKNNVIGFTETQSLLVKVDNEDDLEKIQTRIKDAKRNKISISAIKDVKEFQPELNVDLEDDKVVKARLFNYGDERLNVKAQKRFENTCNENNISFQKLDYASELIMYRLSGLSQNSLDVLSKEDEIFSLRPMSNIVQSRIDQSVETEIKPIAVQKDVDYYKIGIFDGGIKADKFLSQWKDGTFNEFNKGEYGDSHGSFIAGIINYGDLLQNSQWIQTKPFKITEAVVFPNSKYGAFDEHILIDLMSKAVKKNPEVKVWNLSLGSLTSIIGNQYSEFAVSLDKLQQDNNILIVKSAGNCENYLLKKPVARITEASESVHTLVVGSVAHKKSENDIADVDCPSPFSMSGPGISDTVKPELVHYGGNAGIEKGVMSGVTSFTAESKIVEGVGTSFAAPRVCALAAELAGKIKGEFNPLLIKALLIHSAKYGLADKNKLDKKIALAGFGKPSGVQDIVFNDPDEATLIFLDAAEKGTFINILDFPYPQSLKENGKFYGQIKITLVANPLIDPAEGIEYLQSRVKLSFGTYDIKTKAASERKRREVVAAGGQNLLLPDLYSSVAYKKASADFNSERFLRSYTNSYQPIRKWVFDLDELTPRFQKFIHEDKLWFLNIESSFRNSAYVKHKLDKNPINQEFALIVTIRDPKRKAKVYNEVNQLLSKFNFRTQNIDAINQVRITKKT